VIRSISLWLAVLALTLTATPAPAEVAREVSRRAVPATGLKALRISNLSGSVLLRPSADGQLHIEALKVLHGSAAERARLSSETRVDATEEQGVYVVKVLYQQRARVRVNLWDLFSHFELPYADVELTLDVPGTLPVQVSTASGDVESRDVGGPQQISTSSGDIQVSGARGPVDTKSSSGDVRAERLGAAILHTTSGDLVITDPHGPLVARSSSGDISVEGASDTVAVVSVSGDIRVSQAPRGLSLSTSSGEVVVAGAAGRVNVESTSGDVRVGLRAPLTLGRIASSSGDLAVKLGPGIGCALEIRTSSGTLDVAAPVQIGEVNRHALTAKFGNGTAPLTLHTTSGDIHVTSGGN
jgi:DUF4097 and DUF4098 domain-containing protein YvlB